MAEGNTCQTQFWLKLTLLSLQDVQRLLRELEHNCTSRARCSPLECILADCGSREVASIQSPGCAPCPHPPSQTFSFRTFGVTLVLWGWFSYFGVILVLIGPHALDYALCSHVLRYPHFSNMKLQPAVWDNLWDYRGSQQILKSYQ